MNQILRCDWLPERARWSHLARSGLPALSRKKNFPKSHIINTLLTKLVRSRWLDIGLVDIMYGLLTKCEVKMAGYWPFFRVFMDRDSVSVHKHAKKRPISSHLVNNPYIMSEIIGFVHPDLTLCQLAKSAMSISHD